MQNFQKKLHQGPNSTLQTSDDVITKEEFEFKPLVQFQRPLKLIQKLSALTSLFALYQLAYGGLSFSYLPSSFNLASTSLGLLSLILSVFLAIWSTKALKAERDKTLLTQDTVEKTLETTSKVLLLSILVRVAASCVMMPLMVSQGTQTTDTLKNLDIPIPFFELFSCMTFMYAAWTCFRYVKSPGQLMSKLVSISNLAFTGASLALVYNTLVVEKDFENLLAPSLMPQWNITGLKYAGILAGVMSGLTWLANTKKWRVPSFAVVGLMTALVLSLGVFTVNSYTSTNAISEFYQDTTDMNIWSSKMWNVDAKDIEASGCPAKYLPSERCQGSLLVNRWEQNPADSKPAHCLNIACSDILGSLYSSPFLKLSTWAMASVVTGLIVIAGSLYLAMTSFRDTAPRSKKDYGWLGVLIAMVVVFTVAVNMMPSKPVINESGLSMEGLFQTEENRMRSQGYENWFGGSGVEMDSDLSKMISRMFLLKENRFIRMRLNKDYNRALLTQAGDYSLQYQDLVDSLNPYRAEIVFARVPLDSRHDAIVGIVWVPTSISPIERETYLKYYAVDKTDTKGFPVYIATDKESLNKDVVLSNVFRYRTVFLEDEYSEINEQDLIMQRQEMMTTIMAEIPTPLQMSPEDGQELFLMVLAKIYKFIIVNLDIENKKAEIVTRGDWQSTYNDFVQNFNAGDAKVGLIYLDVEGTTRLVAVVFENDQLTEMIQNRNTLPDIAKLKEMGISLYITNDPAQLNLDTLMSAITSQDQTQQQMTQLIEMPYAARREVKYIEKMRENFQLSLLADVGQASTVVPEDLGMQIFDLVAEQKYKFLLQRYNTDENKVELVGTGQWNESNYTTFVKLINTNEPQVGFIFLELEGEKRLVLIVYAPQPQYSDLQAVFKMFGLPSDPRRLESIGVHVYFAHKQADLDLEFILKAIFGDDSSLRKLLVMLDLEDYVVPENKEMRMLSVDDSQSGDSILDTMVNDKTYKYVILKEDPVTNKSYIAKSGDWNSNFDNFVQDVDRGEAQVGLYYLQLETIRKLVAITYVPLATLKTSEQVLTNFGLSSQVLAQRGVKLYTSISKNDLQVKKVLRAIYTDVSAVMQMIQVLLEDEEGDAITSADVTPLAVPPASPVPPGSSPRGRRGKPGKGPVESEQMEELIRDQDQIDLQLKAVDEGGDSITSADVTPTGSYPRARQGKPGKGPVESEQMEELIRDADQIDLRLKSVDEGGDSPITSADVTPTGSYPRARQGKPGKGPVESEQMEELIRDADQIDLQLKAVDEGGDSITSADVTPTGSYPRARQGKPGKGPVESEQMEELIRDADQIDLKLKAVDEGGDSPITSADVTPTGSYPRARQGKPGKGPVESEQMEELIRDQDQIDLQLKSVDEGGDSITSADVTPTGSYPRARQGKPGKGPVESEQMEELIRDQDQIDMNLLFGWFGWGKMGLKLSSDIVKPLKSKKVKYIILKQDADNAVYVASNGTWYATFDQFVKEFNSSVPQVGFIYLEVEGEEKLVMVVYAPDSVNGDAKQVVKDFKVTGKDAAKLKKEGIFTFVVNDLANLTVENAMNSVYSQENQPIIKLMSLMQLYDINIDDYASDIEQAQMVLLDKKGLTLSRNIIQQIMLKTNKYTILSKDASGNYNVAKTGTWHATFDQFVKDFTPTDDQLGFINLEIEQVRKLVMIIYAPNSPDKTDDEIFSDFSPAKSIEKLEKNDVSVYFARILGNINLDMVLNKAFNVRNPGLIAPVVTLTPNISALNLPADIGDALQNQKYKYVVLSQDVQKDITSVDVSAVWGTEYKKFVKDFSGKKDQIALIYLDIESKPRLVLVVFSDKVAPSQILRNFGLPDDEAVLQEAGVQLYVIRKKKELDVFTLLEGIYSQDTYSQNQMMFFEIEGAKLNLFEESDLPLGKDVVDALTNKKYKYMILTHDIKTDTTTVQSTGAWGSAYKDFIKDFTKKDKQIGFIFLEAEAKEILVMIIFAPKVAGTSALKEFGLPDNVAALNNIGIKPYIAHKKKELDLSKVLEGVYSNGTFEQNNPVVF